MNAILKSGLAAIFLFQSAILSATTLSPIYSALPKIKAAMETDISPQIARHEDRDVMAQTMDFLSSNRKSPLLEELLYLTKQSAQEELAGANDREVALTLLEAISSM